MKKCPPGFICFENMTMGFIIVIVAIIGYSIYQNQSHKHHNHHRHTDHTNIIVEPPVFSPNYPYSNAPLLPLGARFTQDILLDPYAPPLKDERVLRRVIPRGAFPINIPTNVGAVDSEYRQVGILTPERKGGKGDHDGGKDKILALMGRPLFTNRDKWQYYSMSDQNNSVKLPVMKNKKSCTNEYGCDQIYNGETIYVKGYNERFRVTIYDDDAIRYLPMI